MSPNSINFIWTCIHIQMESYGEPDDISLIICIFSNAYIQTELAFFLFVQVVRKAFEKTYQMWKKDGQVILQFAAKTWLVYSDID